MVAQWKRHPRHRWLCIAGAAALLVAAGCGDDDGDAAVDPPPVTEADVDEPEPPEPEPDEPEPDESEPAEPEPDEAEPDEPDAPEPSDDGNGILPTISDERCEANQEAGTITFLTGFQYAPAVAIAEIVTAQAMGFYDEMCLDVEIEVSSPATAAPIVGANRAQFASASSKTFNAQMIGQGADIIIVSSMSKTGPSVMIALEGELDSVEDIEGGILGVSGTITGDVGAMLVRNGVDPDGLRTVDKGFDPRIITSGQMDAMIGFKSNEPYQLEQAGIAFDVFDPADYGVVGSFGNMMASREFVEQHPTATEDFVRATLRGFYYAAENPEDAVRFCEELTEGDFDFDAGVFRLTTEIDLVMSSTPDGVPIGTHVPELWETEVSTAVELGLVDDPIDDISSLYTNQFIEAVYDDDGELIWPTG